MSLVGKTYPPELYAVGREKIREYAAAVGETNPLHLDVEAARAAGHADVVAPPMFAVVYAAKAAIPCLFDPELKVDFARLVHGAQEFRWGALVIAGDEITTTATLAGDEHKGELRFVTLTTEAVNDRGEHVSTGTWTNIIRGGGG